MASDALPKAPTSGPLARYDHTVTALQMYVPECVRIIRITRQPDLFERRDDYEVVFAIAGERREHSVKASSFDGWMPTQELVTKIKILVP